MISRFFQRLQREPPYGRSLAPLLAHGTDSQSGTTFGGCCKVTTKGGTRSGTMAGEPRRQIRITLTEPAFDSFVAFAAVAYPDQPLSCAIREACLSHMGLDPLEAAKQGARRAAWLLARAELARMIAPAMQTISRYFEDQRGTAEAELAEMMANGQIEGT